MALRVQRFWRPQPPQGPVEISFDGFAGKLLNRTYSVNPSKLDPGSSNFRQLGHCLSDFRRVHRICTQGKPVKGIARTLNICPKTVRRVLDAGCTASTPTERAPSKLDRYRAVIRYKALERGWQTRAIFKELKALGFEGGETIVKEYVRQIRPKPARRPALRFPPPWPSSSRPAGRDTRMRLSCRLGRG